MNKYETIQTIGQGEYGVVLKAINKETSQLGYFVVIFQLPLRNLKKMIPNLKIKGLFFGKLRFLKHLIIRISSNLNKLLEGMRFSSLTFTLFFYLIIQKRKNISGL